MCKLAKSPPPLPANTRTSPRRRGFVLIWGRSTEIKNEPYPPVPAHCGRCNAVTHFIGRYSQPYFTFFFIPIFPVGNAERFISCTACGTSFACTIEQLNSDADTPAPNNASAPPSAYAPQNPYAQTYTNVHPRPTTTAHAIVSLILGILSFACIGVLTAIPGIIFGIIAHAKIANAPQRFTGKGLATAGIILSAIGFVLSTLVLFPTISSARELSKRSYDLATLRQVAQACHAYNAADGTYFPPTLFHAAPHLHSPRLLKSKFSTTPHLSAIPTNPPDFNAHCDWVYAGADLKNSLTGSANIIVLYSKPNTPRDGRTVAFHDGHTEWVKNADLPAAFSRSNSARAANGLPAITLDGPPPSAAVRTAITPPPPKPRPTTPPTKLPAVEAANPPSNNSPPKNTTPPPVIPPSPPPYGFEGAIADLKSTDAALQRKGLDFIRNKKVTDTSSEKHSEIAKALEKCLDVPELRTNALRALRTWATPENVPALLKIVQTLNPNDLDDSGTIKAAIDAIANTEATNAAPEIAKHLSYGFTRSSAANALIRFGPSVESDVWPYLMHKDFITAQTACNILAKMGTEKSLPALREALNTKTRFVKEKAQLAIDAIEARTKK